MKSVQLHQRWQAEAGHWKVFRIVLLVAVLLFFLVVRLVGQSVAAPAGEGETPVYTVEATGEWLETPATNPEFIVLGMERVVRIATLHRNLPEGAAPGTITLFYDNGGYDLGSWEAVAEPHPEDPSLTYWVVYPDLELFPGCYHLVDSDPATWVNTKGSGGEGVMWIFGRSGASM